MTAEALRTTAAALRESFDAAFAEPASDAVEARVELLAVRVAGERLAIPLSAIDGLYADRPLTGLPGALPELLGLAGIRGSLTAVYDLGALLGLGRSAPRWIALIAAENGLGLAFEELDGTFRVASRELVSGTRPGDAGRHLGRLVEVSGRPLPVLDVVSLVAAIKRLAGRPGPREE
jgi:purine-binding chemotaxis protein CheW